MISVRLAVVAVLLSATDGGAHTRPKIPLASDSRMCIVPAYRSASDPGMIEPDSIYYRTNDAFRRALRDRGVPLRTKRGDGGPDKVWPLAPGACDAESGDLVVTVDLEADRAKDRVRVTLATSRGGYRRTGEARGSDLRLFMVDRSRTPVDTWKLRVFNSWTDVLDPAVEQLCAAIAFADAGTEPAPPPAQPMWR